MSKVLEKAKISDSHSEQLTLSEVSGRSNDSSTSNVNCPNLLSELRDRPKKLIDEGLFHLEASAYGFSERYARGVTPHTVHVWWARRPHSAMRALVFSALCEDLSEEAKKSLVELCLQSKPSQTVLKKAKELLYKDKKEPPKALDIFGGGGTIPFEHSLLGAEGYSIDSNELSVFIQKSLLSYSQGINKSELLLQIQESGKRVLTNLTLESSPIFPLRQQKEKIIGYLWSYKAKCKECGFIYHLVKRPWISKKKGKNIALVLERTKVEETINIQQVEKTYDFKPNWQGRNGTSVCPNCKKTNNQMSIKEATDCLIGLIQNNQGRGKTFLQASSDAIPDIAYLENLEKEILSEIGVELPSSELPKWSGIVNPSLYGIETHSDFLNRRQRLILLLLIKCLLSEYELLSKTKSPELAKCVLGFLSALIDQLVDWNCRLSIWISQNEQVGRAFCGPGVSMYWDYVEIDPVQHGPANLWDKLDRIVSGASFIENFDVKPIVKHAYAQSLPFEDNFFDIITSDPPYYDNIYYNVLADFFYSWKKILLQKIEPELFSNIVTDSTHELVASKFRSGSHLSAHEDYCQQLHQAIKEAERVLKPEGVFTFVYSHSSLRGWEAIIRAFRNTNLVISSVQPLSIERKQRPRAMTSEAVNTCIAFIIRKSKKYKRPYRLTEITDRMENIAHNFSTSLIDVGWHEHDAGMASFAQGVAMLCNAKSVTDGASDKDALLAIETIVKTKCPSFSIKDRKSL